jgi:hypothetical protein
MADEVVFWIVAIGLTGFVFRWLWRFAYMDPHERETKQTD